MNVIEKKVTITSRALYSEDKSNRYLLERIWDDRLPIAAVLMLNPSIAGEIKTDRTVMNVINYLIDNGFGGVRIINLFSHVSTPQSGLKSRDVFQDSINNDYIEKAIEDSCTSIIAWTRGSYTHRKEEVLKLIEKYGDKVKIFVDEDGIEGRHPLHLKENWGLKDYNFKIY
ncbi:DUF1643 domain-containing protein [Bacillus atrophaeus]|uniref:DUF1643 domain-containing protein n=1 Tax=Bacillus atrophaeus TaxID=1452 RepID=UPI002E1E3310|nr:DUF1643 domain-containing protein [Bacillus atrophaeus]